MYNASKTIKKTLESIDGQNTKENYEVIVFDDFSTDNSLEIVENFAEKSKIKISTVKNDMNRGVVYARNKLVEIARGAGYEFAFINDADDISLPSRINNTLFAMRRANLAVFSSDRTQSDGKRTTFPNTDTQVKAALAEYNPITHSSVCFNLNIITKKDLTYPDYPFAEDYALFRSLAFKGYKFYNSPSPCVEYLINKDGLTAAMDELDRERIVRKIIREVKVN
jgi:glycosyltransferase involved in cell wall biosynthesis